MARLMQWLLVGMLAGLLTGCDILRPINTLGDISTPGDISEFSPPAAVAAVQNTNVVIRIQPATQQLNVDDFGNFQIWIDNVTDLFGAEISLQFDPRIIQVQDADPDKEGVQIQPGNFLSPDFVQAKQADNATGVILYTVVQTAPTAPASGNGVLATITFRAIAQGTSALNFITVKLSDPNGQPIQAAPQPGQVVVGSGQGEPTASFTPTSTPIPGQPTPTFTPLPPTNTPAPTVTPIIPTPTLPPAPSSTPSPLATAVPAGATVGFCYRVEAGETLTSIAQKFGTNAGYLNLVNDLNPPGYVFLHQALFIPTQAGQGPNFYIIKAGDTLASIANQCHLPVSFLAFANKLNEDAVIQPGHVLEIPLPPFAPPSRYPYPPLVFPPPYCYPCDTGR